MKNLKKLIVAGSVLATLATAHAYSFGVTSGNTVASVAGLLEVTITAPTAAVAGTSAGSSYNQKIEMAKNLQEELNVFDATGEITAELRSKIEKLRESEELEPKSDDELINLIDAATLKILAGEL